MDTKYCSCSCGGQGALLPLTLSQPPQRKQTRPPLMAQCVTVGLLLLILAALALLLTVELRGRGQPASPDSQLTMKPERQASEGSFEHQHQKDSNHPSAMLTAPKGNKTDGQYLLWEKNEGTAFCHGGFDYSRGSLVVPRDGLYRVFLQITYEGKGWQECGRKLNCNVFVWQKSYIQDKPLLMSVDTIVSKKSRWEKSLYTAGLFNLEADSRLRVTSSCYEGIVFNEYHMFFGAELLPH
ncbi:hypothetical protein PBY51_003425 [Eleginops maclovinus]|uniref:THD domain-containing protein n=1 Tax=Eleginops maclovinus TaxID=56733 RepID=A0AAN7XV28_ELEMC|nr:hypothetical protein PBY51_003425 [Eleginops maclovinus]